MKVEEIADISAVDFKKMGDLVPVIAQDVQTNEILMQAFVNPEALELTLRGRRAVYWSRSRNELWRKGDTSGDIQEVEQVLVDCDGDSLIYRVKQTGNACHVPGQRSCFYRALELKP